MKNLSFLNVMQGTRVNLHLFNLVRCLALFY